MGNCCYQLRFSIHSVYIILTLMLNEHHTPAVAYNEITLLNIFYNCSGIKNRPLVKRKEFQCSIKRKNNKEFRLLLY